MTCMSKVVYSVKPPYTASICPKNNIYQGSTLTVAPGDLKLYWASENSITSRPGDD